MSSDSDGRAARIGSRISARTSWIIGSGARRRNDTSWYGFPDGGPGAGRNRANPKSLPPRGAAAPAAGAPPLPGKAIEGRRRPGRAREDQHADENRHAGARELVDEGQRSRQRRWLASDR